MQSFAREEIADVSPTWSNRRFYNDIAEVLGDTCAAFQYTLYRRLVIGNTAAKEFQQIVIPPADEVTFDHFRKRGDYFFKLLKLLDPVVFQRYLCKDKQRITDTA